jgi:hypothetical protein
MRDLILNELSFQDPEDPASGYPCRNREHARALMQQFIGTLRETKRFPNIRRELQTQYGTLEYRLAEGYSVSQWRNDPEVNRDEQTFLRQRTAVVFSLEDALPPSALLEVRLGGKAGYGLSAAWLLDGICLSLCSHNIWNRSQLAVEVTSFSDDASGTEPETLRHVSDPDHFRDHEDWLQREQKLSIRTGGDLVARAPALYPNVELGIDVQKEIASLSGAERHFGWVVECLESANREILAWTNGPFRHSNLPGPATGESESVRRSPARMRMRVFPSPTGQPVQFEHHMKDRRNNKRMYYRVDTERKMIVIGMLCGHLETAKY